MKRKDWQLVLGHSSNVKRDDSNQGRSKETLKKVAYRPLSAIKVSGRKPVRSKCITEEDRKTMRLSMRSLNTLASVLTREMNRQLDGEEDKSPFLSKR